MATQVAEAPTLGTIEQRSTAWVHRVFRAILCVSLPLMVIVTVGIIFGLAHGHAPAHPLGFKLAAFMAQFSAAAAYNITYAPYVSDYSRYLPRSTPRGKIVTSVFAGASGAPARWQSRSPTSTSPGWSG